MKDPKVIILVVILVVFAAWTFYTLKVSVPKKAEAECMAKIETEVIPQATAAAEAKCTEVVQQAVQQYQTALQALVQIPACANALPQ